MSSSRRRKKEGNGNFFTRKAKTLPEISVRIHFMRPRLELFSWPPLTVRKPERKNASFGHFGTIFSITGKQRKEKERKGKSRSVVSDSLPPHGL